MALPALLSGGARALGTGSKLARTANVGRKLLGTKTNKKGPGRNSPEYENESGGRSQLIVRPSTALIPSTQTSRVGPVDVKVTPVTGKSTLEEDVKYIKDKTIEIDKLLKGSFTQRKKEEAALRKESMQEEKEKKRDLKKVVVVVCLEKQPIKRRNLLVAFGKVSRIILQQFS